MKNIKKVYKNYADLDIKIIMEESISIKDIYGKLRQLIELRYGIVHRLDSDWVFTRKDFLEFHEALEKSLSCITHRIVAKYKLNTQETY